MQARRGQLTLGNQLSILLGHENGLPLVQIALKCSINQSQVQNVVNRSTPILKPASTPANLTTLPLGGKPRVLHFVDRGSYVTAICNKFGISKRSFYRYKNMRAEIMEMDRKKVPLSVRKCLKPR